MERLERSYINGYGNDLYPFRFVKFSDEGEVTLCSAGDLAIGVTLRNYRYTSSSTIDYVTPDDEPVPVVISGITEVECGGTVSAGDIVASDDDGKAVVMTNGQHGNGIALEDGEDGSRIKILITHIALNIS